MTPQRSSSTVRSLLAIADAADPRARAARWSGISLANLVDADDPFQPELPFADSRPDPARSGNGRRPRTIRQRIDAPGPFCLAAMKA